ncbi:maternal protein tudor isoform X2 [Linepithema humile]|uniref:maternal protein tudor isoform X2 n=1 Tax=Linepithema humile TaxID=83485 RepID=UPI00351E48A4
MMQPSSEFVIFVTHVEPDDTYLKIWGQVDKSNAALVERQIYSLIEHFNQGYVSSSKANRLIGSLCCARFQTDGYYRAKILSIRPDNMMVVQFIDYGNIEILSPNDVHLMENIPGSESLQTVPAIAAEFILANVMPINCVWENRIIETIKRNLCYNEYRATSVHTMNNRCLIKLWYNNEDFSELLVKERMALPASIQDMFRPNLVLQPQIPIPQQSQMPMPYQPQNKGNVNNYVAMPIIQNPNMNHNTNIYHKTFCTGINQYKPAAQVVAPPQSSPVQEALVFKSRVLDIGSKHEVLISCVEDGPQKFSVQVESTKDVLTRLMNEINSRPKQSLQEPPLPGSVCLGRYTGDGVLCRAVVMSVMEHKCKLYYVDFGHTEVLPYTDIFQLPPEYINPKVLSIRFTLSGLKELNVTQEMKQYFTELVHRKVLVLHVRPPEGPPLIQYGDLYDNNVNIKDMLKKAFPPPAAAMPITHSYPQLRRLSKDIQEIVYVSYVESCKRFFVQLENGIRSLDSIMAGLTQYANTAAVLNIEQLKPGLPCAALYESQWYRAQILNIVGDQVKVVYVDYGNEEVLSILSIRAIHDDLVTKLPAQALKCALNGYEVLSSDQDVSTHFEKLTLEKRFYMKVVAAQPDGLLVDLFEFDTMRSIHPQLLNNIFCDKTDDSTISSRNEEVQHSIKTTNDFQSENKDRYNKKNNTDSWNHNQNAKSFQDNKPNTWRDEWSQEKQYDNNRREKLNYSHRDSPQNDRFSKDEGVNNRYSRDRNERSYNKYDKGEANTFNRGARGTTRDGGNRFGGNERRYNHNSFADKSTLSDKDSDSSKDGTKRGKSGFNRSFNDDRGGNRFDNKTDKFQTPNWNNKKPTKPIYRNEKFNGDYNKSNNEFRSEKSDTSNVSYNQINTCEWDSNNTNKTLQNNLIANAGSQFSSINITLGTMKNCEVVFINDPTDFFIQLNPDCLELDVIVENIAAFYENGGETMQVSQIQCGVCCIAQYSVDLKWYRAIIKSLEETSAIVKFIDYGNMESVDFTKIKIIQDEFLKLPMQAIQCKLFGLTNINANENKYTIFSEKVEGKSLQVEFVNEENGVYEVLLREIIEGEPNNNYINEEFCAGVDLTQTAALNKKALKVTTQEIPVVPDYAPFDSKWQVTSYEPEFTCDAIVTWFINPNKFYCQILTKEAEFKAMMNEIQKTYAGRKPVTHKLEVGSAVIAMFSEDKALYRAEVVSIEQKTTRAQVDAYVVQYIDFGNCAILSQRSIYSVEKKFMQLPKLAVQCSLKDIVPNNNLSWSEMDTDALDNCFNADKYECIFYDFSNNNYTVSLTHDGQNVSDMLVQKNLASFATKTFTETACVAETEVERMDINLLSGQTLKMRVSNVESTLRFHVQHPSASKCENIVDKYMADKNTEALALPGDLAIMQNQALECSLYNVPASPDLDKQLKEFEGKEVLIRVKEVEDNRLFVKLYDLSGNGIINTEEEDNKILPICPLPIISSTQKVSVSYAEHSASIWLQRYSDIELEAKLLEDLAQYYAEPRQKLKPEAHLLCAAKSLDNQWYRAKIISCTETTAYVHYIDYGNNEVLDLESIMVLEPQFYEPYMLTINVSLPITLIGTEAEQINILQTYLTDRELTAVFYNVHEKWTVDLMENEEKFSDKCRSLNLIKEEETAEKSATDRFDVYVSHVDSPSQFWLQRVDKVASLGYNQTQLQQEVFNFPTIDDVPEEGSLCAAVYSIDNLWYRAEVLDADEDITTVRFVDYGNTDVINNKVGNIRQIPESCKNLERFAQKCRLDIIPVDTEDWNETTCERFSNLVMSVDTLQALVVADTTPKRVELFINDKSVSETLVEEKHAVIINTEQEPVDEIVDLELDPHSAFVCHANSLDEFWVQEEKSVADLEVMADRFMVADMFPKIEDVKEGLLCVAKFPEDDQWYRARVISHDDKGTQVIYIDYGNSAVSTEIRTIPDDLANIPPLSRKCCLELPSHIKEWSEQAREEFINLSAEGATIFLLDVLKEQEKSSVKLTYNGQNVADILAGMCEQHSPVIEERLPPLGEENSPNVVISHINDPSEFWIQTESNMNELEVMSDRLQDAESFLTLNDLSIGTVCAARYPEDGYWYRAKIVRYENAAEVLYLDYGNSAITEELRMLPEDIVNIPILSKRCTLEKPSHIATWSEKACEKFKELAADGATMFEFQTLDEDDPIHVRLNLNGINVVDLLLSECENIPKVDEAPEVEEITETEVKNVSPNTEKNDDEKASNLNEIQQEPNNQMEELEDAIDEEVLNESSLESFNVNKEYEYKEEQNFEKNTASLSTIEENINETTDTNEISENISTIEINKDLDINDKMISTNLATNALCFERSSPVTELSVDDIIENMIKNAIDDRESREVVDSNLLVRNEEQSQAAAQIDTDELPSQTQSENMNKSLVTQILERTISDVTENVDSIKISSEEQLQDITQLDTSHIEEQKIHAEMQSDVNEPPEPQTSETIPDLSEEQQIPKSVNDASNLNGTHNLETQSENIDTDNSSNTSSGSACTIKTAESVTKTDPDKQNDNSRRPSKDETTPRCTLTDELPASDPEAQHPVVQKIPHSEKLVTAAVNPIVQTATDSANQDDEAVVDNIPKHTV